MRGLILLSLVACDDKSSGGDTAAAEPVCEAPGPLDDTLRLNHAQALGTHNSYHLAPDSPLDDSWAYSHAPLGEQLQDLGIRQVELDLHLNTELGWQVFHIPNVDAGTTCLQFSDCLAELKGWSDANPCHLPLTVWLEPKDDIDAAIDSLEMLSGRWGELEEAILEVWPRSRIFTPDDLRGDAESLPLALSERGWPTLSELRGKVLFALLDSGDYRDEYLSDAPVAEGRLLFPRATDPDEAFAAVFKIDDPIGGFDEIRARVSEGYLVTCTADSASEPDEDNAAGLEAALSVACHSISTDLPVAAEGSTYTGAIPEGNPARCNPVSAPAACTAEALEDLD